MDHLALLNLAAILAAFIFCAAFTRKVALDRADKRFPLLRQFRSDDLRIQVMRSASHWMDLSFSLLGVFFVPLAVGLTIGILIVTRVREPVIITIALGACYVAAPFVLVPFTLTLAHKKIAQRLGAEFPQEGLALCAECGYDLRGLPEGRCPECGRSFDVSQLLSADDILGELDIENIFVHTCYSAELLAQANRLHARHRQAWFAYGVLVVGVGLFVESIVTRGDSWWTGVLGVGVLAILHSIMRHRTEAKYMYSYFDQVEDRSVSYILTRDALFVYHAVSVAVFRWDEFIDVACSDQLILLYSTESHFIILPRDRLDQRTLRILGVLFQPLAIKF